MTSVASSPRSNGWPRWWRRFQLAARRANFFAIMEVASALAFVIMTAISWYVISDRTRADALLPTDLTAILLVGTLIPALGILVLLGRRLALQRARDVAGGTGQLHVRLVFLFSLISAVPTLLVAIFASFLFQSAVEFWFSDKSRGLLENSNKLALGFYEQTENDMKYSSLAMAGDLRDFLIRRDPNSDEFLEYYEFQVSNRDINDSIILKKVADGSLQPAAYFPGANPLSPQVSARIARQLDQGADIVVDTKPDKIEALTPIDRRLGLYLYTARMSDLLSLAQGQRAQSIVRDYAELTQRTRNLQLQSNVALFVASLALVGLSVWFALRFADRQVKPLYDLVDAAREVGAGNFSMRVAGRTGSDEIGLLNRAFNRMTQQLERQTQALVGANQQLDERRAFIEAVLESVTAGVVSTGKDGEIRLMNGAAQKLLVEPGGKVPIGQPLYQLVPQFAALLESGRGQGIVQYARGNDLLTLAVKTSASPTSQVVTFEDITRQLLDQRQAAWSDVARRIAHEIKNPLTPIQLATERLKRRYRKQVTADADLFDELTNTIIRQVGDLRKMVDEFSSFARLPKPVFRREDPVDLARQALFLQEVARPEINFSFAADPTIGLIACDRHQFGQAMTNVLKNATEAIEARQKGAEADYRGQITLSLCLAGEDLIVTVTDNGIGLPQDRERIIEPYVTTREKGTGLGLAIVNKIVEEHGGEMSFGPGEGQGTVVTMRFARDPLASTQAHEATA